ncbi:SAP domain-containing protein [Thiohalomonas denitrificans]|uniref:SAP domain-containing protein n=1 Tax=Thiohalomonas denitrificans TaxID=415747 RepID=UPI0026EC9A62|nr:SAP domain-containing protein [Thiohalomonas denitrificans]
MRLEAVRALAREGGIVADNMRKIELVRILQRKEGHAECFGRPGEDVCRQWNCLWREDCLPARAKSIMREAHRNLRITSEQYFSG